MILEMAILQVKPGMDNDFESSFREASKIIAVSSGYYDPFPAVEHYVSIPLPTGLPKELEAE